MLKYTNFGGEEVELPEIVKYRFRNAYVEIHGIDARDCLESLRVLEERIGDLNKLEYNIVVYTPNLREYNRQK